MVETRRSSSSPNPKGSKASDASSSNNGVRSGTPAEPLGPIKESPDLELRSPHPQTADSLTSMSNVPTNLSLVPKAGGDLQQYAGMPSTPCGCGGSDDREMKDSTNVNDGDKDVVSYPHTANLDSLALDVDTETGKNEIYVYMELMSHSSRFLLPPSSSDQSQTYALVVLNQRLLRSSPLLWSHAQLRLCADGGANRLYDDMPLLLPDEDEADVRRRYKPDVIKGDLDSTRKEVLEFYADMGTKIVDESDDQDTTDLHKCVAYICDWAHNFDKSNLCILVAGALGGRFDLEIGNINVLCRFSTIRIILLSDDCLIHLLPRTHRHEIHIQPSVEGPHCGLVPIGAPSGSTTTTGLQWDRNETEMRFGGLISTSNLVKEEKITVQSDSDLLWTITIKKL